MMSVSGTLHRRSVPNQTRSWPKTKVEPGRLTRGWALFEAKDPTKNVSVDYETSCISCHTPVEDSDWVYAYGYPDLKKPKK